MVWDFPILKGIVEDVEKMSKRIGERAKNIGKRVGEVRDIVGPGMDVPGAKLTWHWVMKTISGTVPLITELNSDTLVVKSGTFGLGFTPKMTIQYRKEVYDENDKLISTRTSKWFQDFPKYFYPPKKGTIKLILVKVMGKV